MDMSWWPLDWHFVPEYYARLHGQHRYKMFTGFMRGNHHEAQVTLPNGRRFTVKQDGADKEYSVLAIDAWGRSTLVATPEPLENEFELKAFLIAEAQS